jgi:hypothetical protein
VPAVDAVRAIVLEAPAGIEVKHLAGQIVWLREAEQEWVGPAEDALARLRGRDAAAPFWAAFLPS